MVAKSEIPFSLLFTDQALEQEIKKLKGNVGWLDSQEMKPLWTD